MNRLRKYRPLTFLLLPFIFSSNQCRATLANQQEVKSMMLSNDHIPEDHLDDFKEQKNEAIKKDEAMCEEMLKCVNTLEESSNNHIKMNRVLLVGGTGVGKTTTISYLLNHKLEERIITINTPTTKGQITTNKNQEEEKASDIESDIDSDDEGGIIVIDQVNRSVDSTLIIGHHLGKSQTPFPRFYPVETTSSRGYKIVQGYIRRYVSEIPSEVTICVLYSYGDFVSGYFDTIGFNDSKNSLRSTVLNNFLVQSNDHIKAIVFVNKFGKLKMEKGKIFLRQVIESIKATFQRNQLYKEEKGYKPLDRTKIEQLFNSVFFFFTHWKQGSPKEYFQSFLENYRQANQNNLSIETLDYIILLETMLKKKNYCIIKPFRKDKLKKIERSLSRSTIIPRKSFSFIGRSDEKRIFVSFLKDTINKTLIHIEIINDSASRFAEIDQDERKREEEKLKECKARLEKLKKPNKKEKGMIEKELKHYQAQIKQIKKEREVFIKEENKLKEKIEVLADELADLCPEKVELDETIEATKKESEAMSSKTGYLFSGVSYILGADALKEVGNAIGTVSSYFLGKEVENALYNMESDFVWSWEGDDKTLYYTYGKGVKKAPIESYQVYAGPEHVLICKELEKKRDFKAGKISFVLKKRFKEHNAENLYFKLKISRKRKYMPEYASTISRLEQEIAIIEKRRVEQESQKLAKQGVIDTIQTKIDDIKKGDIKLLGLIYSLEQEIAKKEKYIKEDLPMLLEEERTRLKNAKEFMKRVSHQSELIYKLCMKLPTETFYQNESSNSEKIQFCHAYEKFKESYLRECFPFSV